MRILLLTVTLLSVAILAESLLQNSNLTCHSFITANVGLFVGVPSSESRTKPVRNAIHSSHADVICAQEFWYEEDMAIVLKGNEETYPHHFSRIHDEIDLLNEDKKRRFQFELDFKKRRGSCSVEDTFQLLFTLYPCAKRHGCQNAPGGIPGVGACVITNCRRILQRVTVREQCIQCIFLNMVSSILDSAYYCHAFRDGRRFNSPGLMLLSNREITSARYRSFFPGKNMMIQRGYIEAEIEDVGTVICTHLSSPSPIYFEYDLNFQSYDKQQVREIEILSERFANTHHVLLGDMNNGPKVMVEGDAEKTLVGELPDNYQLLLKSGYSSTYLEDDGRCTLCPNNPLRPPTSPQVAVDHIFVKGHGYDVEHTVRFWDTPGSPLSDHYAVEARVCQ